MFSSISPDGIRRRGFFRRISILSRLPSLEGGIPNNGDTLDNSRIIALLSGRALLGDVDHDNGDIARYRDFLHGSGLDAFLEHVNGTAVSSRGSAPASRSAIEAMPVFKFGKQDLSKGKAHCNCDCDCDRDHNYHDHDDGDGDDDDDDDMHCAVCKEAFEIDNQVSKMPCGHMYHSECILPWLALHSTCPICRREMPSQSESESESESEHHNHNHLANREITDITDIQGQPYPRRSRQRRRRRRGEDQIGVGVAIVGDLGFGIHVHSVTLWGMDNNGPQANRIQPENHNANAEAHADRIGPPPDIVSSLSSTPANPVERPQISFPASAGVSPLERIGTRTRTRRPRGNKLWNWVPMFGIQCCISMS